MIEIMKLPTHVALIPDGNRRWAKRRGLPSFVGHQKGAEAAEKVFDAAYGLGIKYLSFWAGSISNLTKRSESEVKFLFELYEQYFKKILKAKELHERKARVRVLGEWKSICPRALQTAIEELEAATSAYTERHLTILLAYNGTNEVLGAVNSILAAGLTPPISSEVFKKHLLTKDLPPVDLIIRSGVENDPHNSAGFMMWDAAEAQFYFTRTEWPDFGPEELKRALADFSARTRRLGA